MATRQIRPLSMLALLVLLIGLLPEPTTAQAHSFIVYNNPSFADGWCYSDTPMTANIASTCNEQISSVELAAGWSARLYRDQNQNSPSFCLSRTDADLADNTFEDGLPANDAISSFTLYNQPWCAGSPTPAYPLEVFNDAGYAGGWCYSWQAETANISSSCNDLISSILLRAGWSIRVYRDQDQGGANRCLTASDDNLTDNTFADGSGMNDAISSFVLYNQPDCPSSPPPPPSYALEVYTDPNYAGSMCYSNAPMTANIHATCNEHITSLKLRTGWSVRVYRDLSRQGPSRCITASDVNLAENTFEDGSIMNDAISSFVLYQQMPCPTINITPEPSPVELTGIEITQAIQNLRNDTPLIADRRTIVRAYVHSSARVPGVIAELIGTRNGQPLPGSPLRARNTGGRVTVLPNPKRGTLRDSFYFELPSSWRSGDVELEVRGVTNPLICHDTTATASDCRATASFKSSPAIEVNLVGLNWYADRRMHSPSTDQIREVAQQLETILPVPYVNWKRSGVMGPYYFNGAPSTPQDFTNLNNKLRTQRILDGCGRDCKRYYLGMLVDQPANTELNGMAYDIPADIATAYVTSRFSHPHELGHALGRYHVTCTGDERGTGSYPYRGGHISQDMEGNGAFYGFNLNNYNDIYQPSSGDLMSYCNRRWVSDYTYKGMQSHLARRYGTSPLVAVVAMPILSTDQPALVVTGVLSPTEGTGSISSIYQVPSPMEASASDPGDYSISYEDATGISLASYPFAPEAMSEGVLRGFSLLLPWNAQARHVVLRHGQQVLERRTVSTVAPEVVITSVPSSPAPTGVVAWIARDPDSAPLTYVVQYSPDGGSTWSTLVVDWPEESYTLPLDQLPGGANARVRVYASDGVLTGEAVSAPFTVARTPPQVTIEAPMAGALLVEAQTVVLEGSAYDKEDGQIVAQQLRWTSNLDGELGTGASLPLDVSLLTEGEHIITLAATDNDGQIGTITTTLRIARERPALPPSLTVAPLGVSFIAHAGTTAANIEELAIRNEGDGDLSWTATADQPWIKLGATSGNSDNLTVTVDAAGLVPGSYTGAITVTGAGGSAGSRMIEVALIVTAQHTVYLPLLQP